MTKEPEGYAGWKKAMSAEELRGIKERIERSPPIGMLPNGELNIIACLVAQGTELRFVHCE
jgi:hypothetical protein